MQATVLYLGAPGSPSHLASRMIRTVEAVDVLPAPTVSQLLHTADTAPGTAGILPIATAVGGDVTSIVDALVFETSHLVIRETLVLTDRLEIFRSTGHADVPTTVVVDAQTYTQGEQLVRSLGIPVTTTRSETEACDVLADPSVNALAVLPASVARARGLEPSSLPDVLPVETKTQFVVLSRTVAPPTGVDKTMIAVTPPHDRPGGLADILAVFRDSRLNLEHIHNRPIGGGNHVFVITLRGHFSDDTVRNAVGNLLAAGNAVKLLGSFPEVPQDEPLALPYSGPPAGSIGSPEGLESLLGSVLDVSGRSGG